MKSIIGFCFKALYSSSSPPTIHGFVNNFSIILLFFIASSLLSETVSAVDLRVGVSKNPPIAFMDSEGDAKGLAIDLLSHIASLENWNVTYVSCSWRDCLNNLNTGVNDIQVGMAFSEKRNEIYNFNNETVIANWGQVFTRSKGKINSFLELEGKTLLAIENSIHTRALQEMLKKFGVNSKFIEVDNYTILFARFGQGNADGGIVSRLFALQNSDKYGLNLSPLIFNPIEIRFAAIKGRHQEILVTIDNYMADLKADKQSVYYAALDRWFGGLHGTSVPSGIIWFLAIAVGLLALFFVTSTLFKIQVGVRTRELKKEITERKQTEAELQESVGRYRDLVEGSLEGILLHKDFKTVFANKALADILGFGSVDEIMELPSLFEFIHPQERERLAGYTKAIEAGKEAPSHFEVQAIGRDGSTIWLDTLQRVVTWKGQQAIQATVFDITQRKGAEEALRESEIRNRSILETARDAIISINEEGLIESFNQSSEQIFGYTAEEVIGRNVDILMRDDLRKHHQKGFERYHKTGVSNIIGKTIEVSGKRKDGSIIPLEMTIGEAKLIDKKRFTGVLRDITERKQMEMQFHHAQKLEAVGTLAGGIAHNFNNLLGIILGNITLMRAQMDRGNPHYEILSKIETKVLSGSELSKQLLGFARGGKYELKSVNLNTLILHISDMFGRAHKAIRIDKKLDAGLWNGNVDEGQIEQVLLNLLVNSWQAMPRGGEINIQSGNVNLDDDFVKPHQMQAGKFVKLSVTDTGMGMDKELQTRIFEPFFTTKEMTQGSGLGLASAYGIVKNHEGIITVESEPGKGTTFEIYLPATDEEPAKQEEASNKRRRGTGTILLVDDEEELISAGQLSLKMLGYDVLVANDGNRALEIFEKDKERVDLVILDMIMPGKGGGEVFDKLREMKPDVKVLLSSGYSLEGEAQEIMNRGCEGFIQKPFALDTLSLKLFEVLERK